MASYQAVIPAGGRASRLGQLVTAMPKALLPVAGRPFLFYLLDWLEKEGIERAHLCLGHMSDLIIDAVQRRGRSLAISYTVEGKPLGVAGALRAALPYLDSRVVMIYGDVLPKLSPALVLNTLVESSFDVVLGAAHADRCEEQPNLALRGNQVIAYGAGSSSVIAATHLDIGIGAIKSAALALLPPNCFLSEKNWYAELAKCDRLGACLANDRSIEIGSVLGYAAFCEQIAQDSRT